MNTQVSKINKVIENFFTENSSVTLIPAKDLMLYFIKAGVFLKDYRNGLPIRNFLRELNERSALHLIPSVHPERKKVNTYWFFKRIK